MYIKRVTPFAAAGPRELERSFGHFLVTTAMLMFFCGIAFTGCAREVKVPTKAALQSSLPGTDGFARRGTLVEESLQRFASIIADKSRPDVERAGAAAEIARLFESRAIGTDGESAAKAIRVLRSLQDDSDDEVSMHIASAILKLRPDDKRALLTLTTSLQSIDPDVREVAAYRLGTYRLDARIVVPALTDALKDYNAGVRAMAAQSLGLIGSPAASAVPSLIEALGDDNKLVRISATQALRDMPKEAALAVPSLEKLMNSMDHDIVHVAKQALDSIRDAQKVNK